MSLPRETGSEKSTGTCPTCGGPLPLIESAYGSLAPGKCPTCTKPQERVQAAQGILRTRGTDRPETKPDDAKEED
jgi:ssDNA-binding Zn-finger/Zn-ribbon topoisomerase 1